MNENDPHFRDVEISMLRAALARSEEERGRMRWIACSERNPPDEGCPPDDDGWPTTYLTMPHYSQVCYFDGAWREFDNDKDSWVLCRPKPTHWMPMPAPPAALSTPESSSEAGA